MAQANPIARKDYRKHAQLQRDLEKYYKSCMPYAKKRFKSLERRKQYCSGVAWKRARMSRKYNDYFRENPITTHIPREFIPSLVFLGGATLVIWAFWK
jgi:hypothetical protein